MAIALPIIKINARQVGNAIKTAPTKNQGRRKIERIRVYLEKIKHMIFFVFSSPIQISSDLRKLTEFELSMYCNDEILEIINSASVEDAVKGLKELALDKGGHDNVTLAVIENS